MDTAITSRVVSGTCDGWFTWRWYSCSMAGVWVVDGRCMADVWLMHAVGMAVAFELQWLIDLVFHTMIAPTTCKCWQLATKSRKHTTRYTNLATSCLPAVFIAAFLQVLARTLHPFHCTWSNRIAYFPTCLF